MNALLVEDPGVTSRVRPSERLGSDALEEHKSGLVIEERTPDRRVRIVLGGVKLSRHNVVREDTREELRVT